RLSSRGSFPSATSDVQARPTGTRQDTALRRDRSAKMPTPMTGTLRVAYALLRTPRALMCWDEMMRRSPCRHYPAMLRTSLARAVRGGNPAGREAPRRVSPEGTKAGRLTVHHSLLAVVLLLGV